MIKIITGNCLDVMRKLQANSVDSCVTDPPYDLTGNSRNGSRRNPGTAQFGRVRLDTTGKGFMGHTWDGTGIAFQDATWREVLRVLKPGGHLLVFGGTRTAHKMILAVESVGFEIRDTIHWTYGQGFNKVGMLANREGGAGLGGIGGALKPAHELIVLARKPLSEKTVVANVRKWGVGALFIDACRVASADKITNHSRSAEAAKSKGRYGDSKTQKTHQTPGQTIGRWPSNCLITHSPECIHVEHDVVACIFGCPVRELDTQSGVQASRYFSVFRYESKVKNRDPYNTHPTVKPVALMAWLIKLVTPPDGVTLDPFLGSGTTLVAAKQAGFSGIGIEREPSYVKIAKRRL